MFVQQVLSSFANILWPSVLAVYSKFPRTSTKFPFMLEAFEDEDKLYFSNTKVLALLMSKCTKLLDDLPGLLGPNAHGNRAVTTQINAVQIDDRIEIGFRLFYVHLAHLVFLAFVPRVKGSSHTKAYVKQMTDVVDAFLTYQRNGPIRCTMADSISQLFQVDLTFLGQLYMEHKCMPRSESMPIWAELAMPTWAELSLVITDQMLISSSPPNEAELRGRRFLQNPFFRTMAPNAVPGSLDSVAWTALPQFWRVVVLMLMVRTLSLICNTHKKNV